MAWVQEVGATSKVRHTVLSSILALTPMKLDKLEGAHHQDPAALEDTTRRLHFVSCCPSWMRPCGSLWDLYFDACVG